MNIIGLTLKQALKKNPNIKVAIKEGRHLIGEWQRRIKPQFTYVSLVNGQIYETLT